jgi:gliding motility-associated-like protein
MKSIYMKYTENSRLNRIARLIYSLTRLGRNLKVFAVVAGLLMGSVGAWGQTTYYLKSGSAGSAHLPASWNTVIDGTGSNAASFAIINATFEIPIGINGVIGSSINFGVSGGSGGNMWMNIKGTLTISSGALISLQDKNTYTTIVTVFDGGSIIFSGNANQINGNLNGSGLAANNRLVLAANSTLKTVNISGIYSTTLGSVNTTNTSVYFDSGANYEFNGTSAQATTGLPSAVNNLTINNSAGVTLSAATTVSGTLTLTSGKLTTTSTNIVSVTNTAAGAIAGYSASAYVNGPVERTFANGGNYFFPIGDADNYRPFEMLSVNCSSPVVRVTMSSSGASTYDGSLTAIGARNWYAERISGDISNATVRITEGSLTSSNVVASSSAQLGSYTSKGGNSIGTTVTSNASIAYTASTYFAVGTAPVTPTIVLSNNGTQIGAANVTVGTNNVILHKSALAVTDANATLAEMTATTSGTYVESDITNLKVWYQTSSTFDAVSATILSTLINTGTAGTKTFPTFDSQVINSGSTGYIYITADVATGAVVNNTISINALTTSNFTFSLGSKSGSTTAGGTQTFVAGTASKLVITGSGTQVAGISQNITITAKDAYGNTATTYTGDKSITFSGASASSDPVTTPTVKDKVGTAINFLVATTLSFTNGVASVSGGSNGVMTLYKAETATISVSDGSISSSGSDNLSVVVSAGDLDRFTISTISSPQVAGTAITGITITALDAYGNTKADFTGIVTYSGTAGISGTSADFTGGVLSGVSVIPTLAGTDRTFIVTNSGKTGTATFTVNNPTPILTGISPTSVCKNGDAFTLTVYGSNFVSGAIVRVGGSDRTTTFVNNGQLTAAILATDLEAAGALLITVFNPTPGGGTSSSVNLNVREVTFTPSLSQPSCFSDGAITLNSVSGGTAPYTYNWADLSGTSNPKDRTGLQPGDYSVTVTDGKGCAASSGTLTLNTPICDGLTVCQSDDASVISVDPHPDTDTYNWTITSIDDLDDYTTLIQAGQGTTAITVDWTTLPVGEYKVSVTATAFCGTSTASERVVYVKEPDVSASAELACEGGNLQLYASGGVSYSWKNPDNVVFSNSANPILYSISAGTHNGTYTVTITSAEGCSKDVPVVVSVEASPSITGSIITPSECGGATGAIDITHTGGVSFSWSNGATTEDITNLASGNYTVTVTNAGGCSTQATYTVNNSDGPSVSLSSLTNVTCYGGTNGEIDISVSPAGTYTYSWTATNGGVVPGAQVNSQDLTDLTAGTYSVVVTTDPGGCTGTAEFTVSQPNALNADVAFTHITCNGSTNGTITINNPTGGGGTYEYSIDGGSNWLGSGSFTGLSTGIKDVRIRDAVSPSCVVILNETLNITQPAELNANLDSDNVTCNGGSNGSITISSPTGGSGAYQYTINGGTFWQNSGVFLDLPSGDYNVQIRDKNNPACIKVLNETLSITQPDILAATVTPTGISCNGLADGQIAITGATGGAGTYEFQLGSGAWQSLGTFSNLAVATYTVKIRDAVNTGCVVTLGNHDITQPNVLSATVEKTDITCNAENDGKITLSLPSGGYGTYEYRLNTGTWQSGLVFENLTNTTYSVQIRDAARTSCVIILGDQTIIRPSAVSVSGAITNVLCNGASTGEIDITASGGTGAYSYNWDDILGVDNDEDRTGLLAGNYSVTVSDANLCTANASFTVTQPSALSLSTSKTDVTCNGNDDGSINLTVSGGVTPYSYAWTRDGGGYSASTEDISGLSPGTYNVTVTDANGCEATTSVTITQPAVLSGSAVATDATCYGGSNGSIALTVSGGNGSNTFLWSNGSTDEDPTGLSAGTYSVTITDSKNCTATASATVGQGAQINISAVITNVKCNGASTGVIDVTATGGSGAGYEYKIGAGAFGAEKKFENLAAGTYTITVKDGAGCENSKNFTILQPTALSATVSTTDRNCMDANGTATASVTGGVGPYTYSWIKVGDATVISTANSISGKDAGTYEVTVTDANGCTDTGTGEIDFLTESDVSINPFDPATSTRCQGTATFPYTTTASHAYTLRYSLDEASLTAGNTINAITGAVTYSSSWSGTTSITATATGCNGPATTTHVVTVNPTSVGGSISGGTLVCTGTNSTELTLSENTGSVVKWQSSTDNFATVVTDISNTNYTYTAEDLTVSTYYRAVIQSGTCSEVISSSAEILISATSVAGTADALTSTICEGTNATLVLNEYEGTIQWQQSANGIDGWADVTGGSGATTDEYITPALSGNTFYRAVVSIGSCSSNNSNVVEVIVTPTITGNTSGTPIAICTGTSTTLTEGTVAGGNGSYTYLWESSNALAGTYSAASGTNNGANYTTASLTADTWFRRRVTSGACTDIATPVKVTVNPNNTISLSSAAGTVNQTVCNNTAITSITYNTTGATGATFGSLPNGVSGSWSDDVVTISGTPTESGTFNYTINLTGGCGTITEGGAITVLATFSSGAITGETSSSYCSSYDPATMNANPTGGAGTYTYQWQSSANGSDWTNIESATSSTYNPAEITSTTHYRVLVDATGTPDCRAATASTNTIVFTISPTSVGGSVAGGTTICSGSTSSELTLSGHTGSVVKWQSSTNGTDWDDIVNTNTTHTSGALTQTTQFRAVVQSGACSSASSSAATITVNPSQPVSVSIAANPIDAICSGTSVTFTASPTNGGSSPSYQWKLNGGNVGLNQTTYTNSSLSNADKVTVVLTSNATCATGSPATSNEITMAVNPLPVTSAISGNATPACNATGVTYSVTETAGSTYQWTVPDGASITAGENTHQITVSFGDTNGNITVKETNSNNCIGETKTFAIVLQGCALTAHFSADKTNVCQGETVTFTSTSSGTTGTTTYSWNFGEGASPATASTVGPHEVTYSSSGLKTISLTITEGSSSTETKTDFITVNTNLTPIVSMEAVPFGAVCEGTEVTYTAIPTNGGTPSYKWFVSGSEQLGQTNETFVYTPSNGEVIKVVMTSDLACVTASTANYEIEADVFACADLSLTKTVDNASANVGEDVVFTITVTNNGPSPAQNVVVIDNLPDGFTFVSANPSSGSWSVPTWTVGDMANGAVATLQITATVNPSGNYTNTASVTSDTDDPTPGDDVDTVTITPETPDYEVTITVVDENGDPIEGAIVTIDGEDYVTDENGQVTIELPDGEYDYTVNADGFEDFTGTITVVGEDVDETVTMTTETHTITIIVVDENGDPIAGATVTINGEDYVTDENGQVTITLPDGTYNYTVVADGYHNNGGTITVEGEDVEETVNMVPETEPTHTITITVVDENGDPIAGATVTINGETYTTDENGQVTVTLPDGTYNYTVVAEGYHNNGGTIIVDGEDVDETVTMTTETHTITITVVDENGDPIEGAIVTNDGEEYVTDENGQVTVVLPDGEYDYTVNADGFEDFTGTITVDGEDMDETITMTPETHTITITVVDENGDPIEGATVTINGEEYVTDENGQVTVVLPDGEYDYTVNADGFEDFTGTITVDGEDMDETITMTPETHTITITVVDENGDPIAGATVTINGENYTTDENGQVTIELPDGEYDYTVEADGYNDFTGTITVGGEDVDEAVIMIAEQEETHTVTITVVDENGDPIEGATVTINGEEYVTDENGQVTLELPNGEYDYTVTIDGYDDFTGTITVGGEDVDETVTMTTETHTVTITVVDENGDPIAGATITINGETYTTDENGQVTLELPNGEYDYTVTIDGYEDFTGTITVDGENVDETITMITETHTITITVLDENGDPIEGAIVTIDGEEYVTDENGQVTLELPNGEYDYTVTIDGYDDFTGTITVGGEDMDETITMTTETHTISITVVDENGDPIEGATVTINGEEYVTDENGQVTLELPNGEYDYTVTIDGYDDFTGTITMGGEDVDEIVTMTTETHTITITVLDENDDPIAGAIVTINGETYTTDENGQVTVTLPDGTYNYTVVADGYHNNGGTITVNGEDVEETVNMVPETEPTYTITITVVDENGDPIEGATVTINGVTYTTDENGQVTVTLPDGTYNYTVVADGYHNNGGTIIVDGEDVDETITMITETHTITITVVDENGDPIEGATVTINGETYTTDENGQVTVTLPDGTYNYTVVAEGYHNNGGTITVEGDDVDEIVTMTTETHTITITVVDENGDPIAGATVTINGEDYVTDENGQVTIELPDGEYDYTVTANGYEDFTGTITVDDENVDETITMITETHTITITVLDENGDPIAGAIVTINGETYTTDENGQVTVTLPDGTYNYTVVADGYHNNGGTITVNGEDVEETVNMVPETEPTYTITITVVDENGDPIEGATVTINGVTYTTDENGQVTVTLPDGTYNYTVVADGYHNNGGTITVDGEDVDETITMITETHTITITVLDENGDPIEGAIVTIDGEEYVTDENGQVTIELPDGEYDYTVTANGYEDFTGTITVDGENVDETITMITETHTITITVVDENGDPIEGAIVTIDGEDYTTDENGQVTVTLPDGTYNYTVVAEGYHNNGGTITVDGEDVEVTVILIPKEEVNISITKQIDNTNPVVGTNVIFTITLINSGPSTATNVVVTDNLPSGYEYVSSTVTKGVDNIATTGTWLVGILFNNESATLTITTTVLPSGNYNNTASVNSDQEESDSEDIVIVNPIFYPVANPDYLTVAWKGSITYDVTSNDWDPADNLNYSSVIIIEVPFSSAQAVANIDGTITISYALLPEFTGNDYLVYQISNHYGLSDTAKVFITVTIEDVVIPNTFSPNDDGINDYFVIPGIEQFSGNELIVYNRWGNIVFRVKDYGNNWDGSAQSTNEPLPVGTYFYTLSLGRNLPTLKGYVYLTK